MKAGPDRAQEYLDVAGVIIVVIDADEKVMLINRKGCEVLGYPEAEIIGRNWFDAFLPKRVAGGVRQVFRRLMAGEIEPLEYVENVVLTASGEERVVAWHNALLSDEEGNLVGALGSGEDITERRRAEDCLRSSEERLRILFEFSPDGYFLNDLRGDIVDVNRAAEEIVGYTREELRGKSFLRAGARVLPLKEIPKAATLLAKSIRGKPTGPDELTLKRKGSDQVTVEIRTFPVTIGSQQMVLGIARDVTQRKQAEQALQKAHDELEQRVRERTAELTRTNAQLKREMTKRKQVTDRLHKSEQRLRDAQLVAHMGHWDWNIITNEIYWCDWIYEALGLNPREFSGGFDAFMEAIHPEDRQFVQKHVDAAVHDGAEYSIDHRIVLPNGQVRYVHEQGQVSRDPDGTPLRMLGTVIDITERKLAEEQLARSEARYRQLLETIPHGIQAIDLSGTVTFVNQTYCRMLGYSEDEITGRPFWSFISDDSIRAQQRKYLRELVEHEPLPVPALSRDVTKDGRFIDIQVDWTYERDEQGKAVGFISMITDITERKQVEEALRRSEQLRAEAEKLAAAGRMAARVAHEINNPLAGIKNSFRVIRETLPENYAKREYLGLIEKEIDRIAGIVRQMFDLHRQERESESEMLLDGTIAEVVAMLEPVSRQHVVSIEAEIEDPPIVSRLPENAVRQILYNLLANGIEATPQGGAVKISAAKSEETIRVSVTDQGPGIPEELRPRVFEPFFTTKGVETSGGLGLGLSICKSITEALHGSLDFENKGDRGCVFLLVLPLRGASMGSSHGLHESNPDR